MLYDNGDDVVPMIVPEQLSIARGEVTVAEHSPVIVGNASTTGTGAVTSLTITICVCVVMLLLPSS